MQRRRLGRLPAEAAAPVDDQNDDAEQVEYASNIVGLLGPVRDLDPALDLSDGHNVHTVLVIANGETAHLPWSAAALRLSQAPRDETYWTGVKCECRRRYGHRMRHFGVFPRFACLRTRAANAEAMSGRTPLAARTAANQHFVEVKLKVNHLRNSYGETHLQIRLLQTRLLQISRIAVNRIAANKIATNKIVKKISPGLRGRRHAWPSRPLRRSFLLRIQPEVPIHCAVAELSDSIHPSQPGPPTR